MILGCVVIILARIGDVSLGTADVAVVSGQLGAARLGLLEMTIWLLPSRR
jgi:hypothetical protein